MARDLNSLARIVGGMVRQKREKLGWSQQYLADLIGESHSTRISYIERGGSLPTVSTLVDLCDALDLDIGTVLKESAKSAGTNGFVPAMRKVRKVARENNDLIPSASSKRRINKTASSNNDTTLGEVEILVKPSPLDNMDNDNLN